MLVKGKTCPYFEIEISEYKIIVYGCYKVKGVFQVYWISAEYEVVMIRHLLCLRKNTKPCQDWLK